MVISGNRKVSKAIHSSIAGYFKDQNEGQKDDKAKLSR